MRTAVLLPVLVFAAGCGGEAKPSPPSPEKQVNAAADKVLHSDDARLVCSKLVTAGFLEEVYDGDVQACIDSPIHEAEDDKNGVEKIVDTQVQGSSAQVTVRVPEGKLEGAGGGLEFAEEGAWKLDRFGTDYLRSAFLTGVQTTDTGALATPQVRRCFAQQVEQLPEAKLRRFSYQAIRDDKKGAMKLLLKLASDCPNALAIYVADAITDGMEEQGRPKAYVRCMRRGIRDLVAVTGLGPQVLKGNINGAGKSALMGLVAGVDANCADRK
jgi:hypothetical protein